MSLLSKDNNGNAIQILALSSPQDIDGTAASAQSAPINSDICRICAFGDIRFLIGDNPTALVTSHFLGDHQEIWLPITPGHKVAIIGGKANIATAGV